MHLASDATKSVLFLFSGNFTALIIKSTSCSNHRSLLFFDWDDVQRLLGDVSLSHDHQVCRVDRVTHGCESQIQGLSAIEMEMEEVEMKGKETGAVHTRGNEKKPDTWGESEA
jgi:hypothetical protein